MEHAKLERAFQCSKHILEYVNQAVKEYENHYKLEHLQRKIVNYWLDLLSAVKEFTCP
jgi:seryl-tRNA(Sec) selenium transferase